MAATQWYARFTLGLRDEDMPLQPHYGASSTDYSGTFMAQSQSGGCCYGVAVTLALMSIMAQDPDRFITQWAEDHRQANRTHIDGKFIVVTHRRRRWYDHRRPGR